MRKEIYILFGVICLALSAFLVAAHFYSRSRTELGASVQQSLESAASFTIGPDGAPVSLVEFLDPECESCRAMHPVVKKILKEFPEQIRYTIRYMPFHKSSRRVSAILEAARRQSMYLPALDRTFKEQPIWAENHEEPQVEVLVSLLAKLPLDLGRLRIDEMDPKLLAQIERDKVEGKAAGVDATPTFFINGKKLQTLNEESLRSAIREQL